jgi:hypothetical protein
MSDHNYYNFLTKKRKDSKHFKGQIEQLVHQLTARLKSVDPTTGVEVTDEAARLTLREGPVLMVGQVQAGKTRAFLAVMAKCFDEGYDAAIVLTKGTRLLGMQTIERIRRDFSSRVHGCKVSPIGSKRMKVFDINSLKHLVVTPSLLKSKLVFVAIKEDDNILALRDFLNNNPNLKRLNTLLIDDEADHGTLSYRSSGEMGEVQSGITKLRMSYNQRDRRKRSGVLTMLQVTATPVDLYFQRDESSDELDYISLQPDYSLLLNPHSSYVGGEHYFDRSQEKGSVESYLWSRVSDHEIERLKQPSTTGHLMRRGGRMLERLSGYRDALVSYLVAGTIRYLQTEYRRAHPGTHFFEPSYSSAFLIHISYLRADHTWQRTCLTVLLQHLKENLSLFKKRVTAAYKDFSRSIVAAQSCASSDELDELQLPERGVNEVWDTLLRLLEEEDLQITVINSDDKKSASDVIPLESLVEDGQLALSYTFNIFIGAQSLDRGITVDHLISFYYGRTARSSMQVDSVLQHSRWYGARSLADIAVTRLHTSESLHKQLETAYRFDKTLREDLEQLNGQLSMIEETSLIECSHLKIIDRSKTPAVEYQRFTTQPIVVFYCKASELSRDEHTQLLAEQDELLARYFRHKNKPMKIPQKERAELCDLFERRLVVDHRVSNRKLGRGGVLWDVHMLRANLDLNQKAKTPVWYLGEYKRSINEVIHSPTLHRRLKDINRALSENSSPQLILLKVIGGLKESSGSDVPLYIPMIVNPEGLVGKRFIRALDKEL